MHPRATELIETLGLQPHPEGGHFSRVYRSQLLVTPSDSRDSRPALTVIYFLLIGGAISRWHQVLSDEAWHHYEGAPLELLVAPPEGGSISRCILGPLSAASAPLYVVPARWWQGARSLGPYTLVGCCVGPGFEFSDFRLLASLPVDERPVMSPAALCAELL